MELTKNPTTSNTENVYFKDKKTNFDVVIGICYMFNSILTGDLDS